MDDDMLQDGVHVPPIRKCFELNRHLDQTLEKGEIKSIVSKKNQHFIQFFSL